jgi:hypothetical protein
MKVVEEYQFTLERAEQVASKQKKEETENAAVLAQQSEELERLQEENEELKQSYKKAKIAKNNHDEYEKLAELISKYPSQEETEQTVANLKDEIDVLKLQNSDMEEKLNVKNGQLQLLLFAIQNLKSKSFKKPEKVVKNVPKAKEDEAEPMELEEGEI